MSTQKSCPLCAKPLSLKQINFTTAVYICEDLHCKYPVDFTCCIEVKRNLEDITKDEDDLDQLVNEVFTSAVSNKDSSINVVPPKPAQAPTNDLAQAQGQPQLSYEDSVFSEILQYLNT